MSAQYSPFPGPTPPENNPPINPQYFQPSLFFIEAIALGQTTLVTTSVNHNYVIGQNVRLLIPPTYGCVGLNNKQGVVISIPGANQFVIDLFSLGNTPFIPSPAYGPTLPQVIPIGDFNNGQINSDGRNNNLTFISGSFINISPL
jgi:hypothetical protein